VSQKSFHQSDGSLRKASLVAIVQMLFDQTAEDEPRKVGMPEAALSPAPVIITVRVPGRARVELRLGMELEPRTLRRTRLEGGGPDIYYRVLAYWGAFCLLGSVSDS